MINMVSLLGLVYLGGRPSAPCQWITCLSGLLAGQPVGGGIRGREGAWAAGEPVLFPRPALQPGGGRGRVEKLGWKRGWSATLALAAPDKGAAAKGPRDAAAAAALREAAKGQPHPRAASAEMLSSGGRKGRLATHERNPRIAGALLDGRGRDTKEARSVAT